MAKQKIPTYRRHKASGQAIVVLSGQTHYLGEWNSPESKSLYDELVARWIASGRQPLKAAEILVGELVERFMAHAEVYYKDSDEPENFIYSVRPLNRLFATKEVAKFTVADLKRVREQMISDGLARKNINSRVRRLKAVFRWGVEEGLVPGEVFYSLSALSSLRHGRGGRETEKVQPVDDDVVEATLKHLQPMLADMVRLQRLTGMRPGEVCRLIPAEIHKDGVVWVFRPPEHKTRHLDKDRIIYIGPKAQTILQPYLERPRDMFCFRPAESERARAQRLRSDRKSPVPPSQQNRAKGRYLSERYDKRAYSKAIARACEVAFGMPKHLCKIPKVGAKVLGEELTQERRAQLLRSAKAWRAAHCWSPNRLRHTAATEARKRFGLEGAQVLLGHSKADVTQIYAERNDELARRIAEEAG